MKARIVESIVLAGLAGFIAFAVSPYGKQARYLWHQHRMTHQVLPANTIIYTEDPVHIAMLRGRPDYQEKGKYAQSPTNSPTAWERKWSQGALEAHTGTPTGAVGGHAVDDTFSGLRTSAGGITWVVNLGQVNPWNASEGRRKVGLTQSSFQPAGWKAGARATSVSFMSEQVLLLSSDLFTLFAPQADPDDASRVKVPYELNGERGRLDAVVTDRGYVQFSVGSGPARMVKWNDL